MNLVTIATIILDLVALKFKRDVILAEINAKKAAGMTDEQVTVELRNMRDKAIADTQALIDSMK
jgi:hypothetical protein